MRLSIPYKRLLYSLICVYPLINILVCYIFKGDNMNTFSIIYCGMLIIILLMQKKQISKCLFLTGFLGIFTIVLSMIRETGIIHISSAVMFVVTIFCFFCFSERYFDIDDFGKYIVGKKHSWYLLQAIYLLILLLHYTQYGLTAGWNTWVLKGPYNYPHTLAYLLLFFTMADAYLWIQAKSGIGFLFAGISFVLIFLTAVRVVLLAAAMAILFMLWQFMANKQFKKVLFFIVIGIVGAAIAYKFGLLEALIRKTRLALWSGSITNGRGNIVKMSIKALTMDGSKGIFNSIFGVGMEQLLASNKINMKVAIHAHNDLIDVLVCYGVINLAIYIYGLYKLEKKHRICFLLCIGVLALSNGLFMYIDSIPMLIFARLFFASAFTRNKNEENDFLI